MFRGIFRISYLPERSRLVPVLAVSGNGVISEVCNVWKKLRNLSQGSRQRKCNVQQNYCNRNATVCNPSSTLCYDYIK